MSTLQDILQLHATEAFLLGALVGAVCLYLLQSFIHRNRPRPAEVSQDHRLSDPTASLIPELASERDLALLHARTLDGLLKGLDGTTVAQRLLQNLVPDPERHFAILLGRSDQQFWTIAHRGRTEFAPPHTVSFDKHTEDAVLRGRTMMLIGKDVEQSGLYRQLFCGLRGTPRQLFVSHLVDTDGLELLLVTSTLPGEALPFEVRRDAIVELLKRISTRLTVPETVPAETRSLEVTREIFELRSLMDLDFRSNLELIEEFLSRLASLSGFQRASVYVASTTPQRKLNLLCRTGSITCDDQQWAAVEDHVAQFGMTCHQMCCFKGRQLQQFGNSSGLEAVLTVPLRRQETLVGVLCLSRAAGTPDVDIDHELINWVADYTVDIILRTVDHAVVEEQAKRDALTQLANRHAFQYELDRNLRWSEEASQPCSLMLVDLDHFKAINDQYGHLAGDETLREVANLLQVTISSWRTRRPPVVARYGGEEFAILLPATGPDEVERIARHLVDTVRSCRITYDGCPIPVTISAGCATWPDHGQTERQLVAAADLALYHAKQSGRDRSCSADEATTESATSSR